VAAESDAREVRERAGLCADCKHAKKVVSSRSSSFYLCRLSFDNRAFRKYPALPVRSCAGYEAARLG